MVDSSTVKGKIIQVDYFLKVCVKYNSWNEFPADDGWSATLAIDILQPPMLQQGQPLPQGLVPADWNPAV